MYPDNISEEVGTAPAEMYLFKSETEIQGYERYQKVVACPSAKIMWAYLANDF